VAPIATLPAVIAFTFPATFSAAGLTVRWETLAGAAVGLLALLAAALVARSTPIDPDFPPDVPSRDPEVEGPNHLRADDLLYIAVSALPGAVIGGRIGYALTHLPYYQANPDALWDPNRGGLELSLAVVGGLVTASVVARLLGAPVGRWLHAAALPLILLLGGIKAAMILGGSGQGLPLGATWATAYLGPGPWGSLAPAVPSWPSQAVEVLAAILVGGLAWWLMAVGVFRRRNGAAFFLALGMWASTRAVIAGTWRDPAVAGTLSAAQLIAISIAAACALAVVGFAAVAARQSRAARSEPPA
jgi:prolipoprotein diacylglyceryltransferase